MTVAPGISISSPRAPFGNLTSSTVCFTCYYFLFAILFTILTLCFFLFARIVFILTNLGSFCLLYFEVVIASQFAACYFIHSPFDCSFSKAGKLCVMLLIYTRNDIVATYMHNRS